MNIKKLIRQAQHYEEITRQYKECEDFLQALEFSKQNYGENISYLGINTQGTRGFKAVGELYISTPSKTEQKDSIRTGEIGVNLVNDLGMKEINDEFRRYLAERVKKHMSDIEKELQSVFETKENN